MKWPEAGTAAKCQLLDDNLMTVCIGEGMFG